ncbi:LysR family transcriptional regulator [Pseudooceanicola sp. CBS1P-1]|uniref:LysR family transcriptional regulator n=1 Tax=Pseudooceanicola albus TaxID=2692189 RepID=A0A6L7G2A5_9RHOB|nr:MULTISPECIES: LysR substrate-binding domain-containing protein [Pseudooceanicola]MBT9383702.1 LysR family transcriptional regulator [Pseudooceanicola endophyticus]MXN17556.1 LysR family transcriptional regulator [Pseudooceanicola albus]
MDTRQMRYFVALAETLHFGHAAARMNMTQPPFSRQIAALERDLGVQLVERSSRQVVLTPAGERFLKDSRAVLAGFDSACREARLVAEGLHGELRFGFMMHAAHSIVPRLVSRYVALRPEVRLTLVETTPAEIAQRLLAGELDAGLSFGARALPQLDSLPVFTDRLCLVVPKGHALAGCRVVQAQDLTGLAVIAAPARVSPTLRGAVEGWFAAQGLLPDIRFEPQLQTTILRLVAAGLGVALVPASIVGEEASVRAVPLEAAPELPIVLSSPAGSHNRALEPLREMIRDGSWRDVPA